MARTPLGHFRRNPIMRFGYGALINYRLAEVTRGVGAAGVEATAAPVTGESQLDVTFTLPDADGDVTLDGRGSWPGDTTPGAAAGMSRRRPEGGIAVSHTSAVNVQQVSGFPAENIDPGAYPRVNNPAAINATVDIEVAPDDGSGPAAAAFGGTVDHRYDAGTFSPRVQVTDQLNRTSSIAVSTGDVTATADSAAPSFSAGPTASDGGAQDIDTTYTVDDNATVFILVVADGNPVPSAEEVINGSSTGSVASAEEEVDAGVAAGVSGISTGGAGTFDVYFVADDGTNTSGVESVDDVSVA